ncbi:hypothetical protein IPJ91_00390 [bacterium]|nr:MAG: hypothetical protein IPJ91_00390 [bacterium]
MKKLNCKKIIHTIETHRFLVVIIAIYILVSLALIALRQQFWYDELFTMELIKSNWSRALMLMIGDGKPFLYYILTKVWGYLSPDQTFLRSSSIIFGIPFLVFTYKFTKEFMKDKSAYLIMLVLAINPLFLVYSTEFRMYSMLASATIIYIHYFYKAVVLGDSIYSNKLWLARFLLIMTSYIGMFFLLAEIIFQALSLTKSSRNMKTVFLRCIKNCRYEIMFVVTCAILIRLQVLIFPNFSIAWVPKLTFHSLPNSILVLLFGIDPGKSGGASSFLQDYIYHVISYLEIAIYISFAILIYFISKSSKVTSINWMFKLLSATFLLVCLGSLPILPISFYHERYLIGILLSLSIAVLVWMELNYKKVFLSVVTILLLVSSSIISSIFVQKIEFEKPGTDIKDLIDFYYTKEIERCGYSLFERKYNGCI